MSVNGELVGATSARRRRERRLRSWWRHEALSVAAALATARHHSAGPEVVTRREGQQVEVEVEQHDGLRAQNTPPQGLRPGVLQDPGPPLVEAVTVGYVAAGVPLLGAPSLADSSAEVIDGSTSPSSYSAPGKSRGRRRRRLWRRRSWSSWRRSLLRRRSGCLRCSGGNGRGPGSLHALPRRSACRSLVPGQRGGWEEEGKEEEEKEEEAEDVEDSPS